ncbi:hypothetical protein HAX54_028591 [Datura stramonium]|uniref:Uncharacterized protein n=1 Tax=Datura stramonium TaxID=4076 RepID=A0ABS8V4C4_DATST|nr:hypothetical protein [Datura stramonium]
MEDTENSQIDSSQISQIDYNHLLYLHPGAKDDMKDIFCVVPPSLFNAEGHGHADAAGSSDSVTTLLSVPIEATHNVDEFTEIIPDQQPNSQLPDQLQPKNLSNPYLPEIQSTSQQLSDSSLVLVSMVPRRTRRAVKPPI